MDRKPGKCSVTRCLRSTSELMVFLGGSERSVSLRLLESLWASLTLHIAAPWRLGQVRGSRLATGDLWPGWAIQAPPLVVLEKEDVAIASGLGTCQVPLTVSSGWPALPFLPGG